MNIKWEVLKLQVHSKLLTGGCLKIKFFIMKAVFQSFILFLFLSKIVFGQEQVHGYFKFIGFFNEPQISSLINKIHYKSRSGCSSECLKDENCYFFDFCKTGSSTSCYFYNNNHVNTSGDQNGMCRRYELVSTLYSSTEFLNRGLCNIHNNRFNGEAQTSSKNINFSRVSPCLTFIFLCWGPISVKNNHLCFVLIF